LTTDGGFEMIRLLSDAIHGSVRIAKSVKRGSILPISVMTSQPVIGFR